MENNKYMVISKEEAEKEKFNSREVIIKETKKFLLYYMQILNFAYEEDTISLSERDFKADIIVEAIAEEVEDEEEFDNDDQISNYLYVIATYLQSMSNWEAWKKLKVVISKENAKILLHLAKKWLLKQLDEISFELSKIEGDVLKLRCKNVIETYNILKAKVNNFRTFDLTATRVDLKSLHSNDTDYITQYMFLTDKRMAETKNYLERLKVTIDFFKIEVGLLLKMNANQLMRYKKEERKKNIHEQEQEAIRLEETMKEKLKILQENYEKDLQNTDDTIAVREAYENEKNKILEQWSKKEKALEKKQTLSNYMQGELIFENNSLQDLIKEYAIFSLANKRKILYPDTLEKRGIELMKLPMKTAIEEFLESDIQFSDEEIAYLKSCI